MKKKKNDTDGMCVPSESSECEKDEKGDGYMNINTFYYIHNGIISISI